MQYYNHKNKSNKIFKIIICLFLLIILNHKAFSQKIYIKNIDKKSIANASVVVQVYYHPIDYLIKDSREKLFSSVTDTSGVVLFSGEFQKETFKVDSVSITIQHENYLPKKVCTFDYSSDPKFSYTIYLVNKKEEMKIVSMPSEDRNELDIYTTYEISKKLNIDEKEVIKLIELKKLKAKKIGGKYFVTGNDLRKYLEE